MEDQSSDRSDLTNAGDAPTTERAVTPVGKRGRHRTFRPRAAPTAKPPMPEEPAATDTEQPGADSATETIVRPAAESVTETIAVDSPAADSTADEPPADDSVPADDEATAEDEATAVTAVDLTEPVESEPKAVRRKWFRRRAATVPIVDDSDQADEAEDTEAEDVEADPETTEAQAPATDEDDTDDADDTEDTEETEDVDDTEDVEDADEPESEPEKERVRKPAGKRLVAVVALAAALFVAAGAYGGAMLQPYLADRVAASTKRDIAQTAANAITTLFTYTPEDMDQLPQRSSQYLGGDLKDAYAKQVDALAAANKQNQVKRSAEVVGAAVESLDGSNATAVVYANISYTSAATREVPRLYLVSYRLSMQRHGSDWVIVNMPWITSKDLTQVT